MLDATSLILQDPFLFSKTIYENIAITNKNVERGRVEQVAQLASMDHDIKALKRLRNRGRRTRRNIVGRTEAADCDCPDAFDENRFDL